MSPADLTSTQPAHDPAVAAGATALCLRCLHAIADGTLADFEALIHPEAVNREAAIQPPGTRGHGPAAFYATALWLRSALSGMRWDIHEVAADGDLIAVHSTGHGRHTGPFVFYDEAGAVRQVFPPTGKTAAATQTHWFRVADGKIIEHWANRDDMAMARQLGWIPPSPRYLARMILAKRKAHTAPAGNRPLPPAPAAGAARHGPLVYFEGPYIGSWADKRCQPFTWTKPADEILARATGGQGTSFMRR